MSPLLWVLAGGNGAGKTTFYEKYLAPRGLQMLSADDVARTLEPADPNLAISEAQAWVEKKRERLFSNMESFCYETVFSHPSKIDAIARAKGHGYAITLTYFHLDTAQLNQARVSQRVSQGGHDVPPEKIVALANDRDAVTRESADLLFHLMIPWAATGPRPEDIYAELARREGTSGIAEKDPR